MITKIIVMTMTIKTIIAMLTMMMRMIGVGTICALSAAAAARHKTGATALPHMEG